MIIEAAEPYAGSRAMASSSVEYRRRAATRWGSGAVGDLRDAFTVRAVRAAEHRPARLDAVPDDSIAAVAARRRQSIDRTLERIERMSAAVHRDRERFVVVVAALLARCHGVTSECEPVLAT